MKYLEIVKKIDELLPSTVDCDYREVDPEKLGQEIIKFLATICVDDVIASDELIEVKNNIVRIQTNNYIKINNFKLKSINPPPIKGSQNSYSIKENVLQMKQKVLYFIITKLGIVDKFVEGENVLSEEIGDQNDLFQLLKNKKDIKQYLNNLFSFSNVLSKFDGIKIGNTILDVELFVNDILLRFGISPNNPIKKDLYEQVEKIIFSDASFYEEPTESAIIEKNNMINEIVNLISSTLRKTASEETLQELYLIEIHKGLMETYERLAAEITAEQSSNMSKRRK